MTNKLVVNEIFRSIDGEVHGCIGGQGSWSIFIRLQKCNLQCKWCDTGYAQTVYDGENELRSMTIDKIIAQVIDESCNRKINKITITGGEPLLQLYPLDLLISSLNKLGFKISVETNGSVSPPANSSLWPSHLVNSWIVDYKLPSSGMLGKMLPLDAELWGLLGDKDFIKFVVADESDFIMALSIVGTIRWSNVNNNKVNFAMSPCLGFAQRPKELLMLMEKYEFFPHVSIQIHKLIDIK